MHKAENGLVIPSDDTPFEEIQRVKQCLEDAGFSAEDQDWLVEVFKRPDCFGDPSGESVFRNEFRPFDDELKSGLETLFKKWTQGEDDGQNRLMLLFSSMLNFGPGVITTLLPNVQLKKSKDGSEDIPQWISEFQTHAEFSTKSLKKLSKISYLVSCTALDFNRLLPFLFPEGVPLDEVVDINLLNTIRQGGWSDGDFNDTRQFEQLEQLHPWLIWRFRADEERSRIVSLHTLKQEDFSKLSDDLLCNRIFELLNAIGFALGMALGPGASLNEGWRLVADELLPFFNLLDKKKPDSNQERSPLLKAWWHLAKHIFSWGMGGLESELSDELRKRLVESASEHIGRLRSVLRDTPEEFENEDVRDFYDKAFYVLLCFAPPWKRLKPLLLAFTEMTEQAVSRDLRTWREHDSKENPPQPYARVPNWIEVAMYPQNLKNELDEDPYLQNLREEFAKFCLERLRTKEKSKKSGYADEDFKEPRPAWRQCYVQALAALRVNPGGRAHRTLFWLLNNDPDDTVRELAKKAHKRVRHLDRNKPNLDEGASPRRPLFEAFWWLRQAHLITLGVEVDQAGAMRTRRRELHRTREKDDRYDRKR